MEFPNAVDDLVEEPAVVGDGDERTFVVDERFLEGGLGFHVQVVGRLVHQQEVVFLQQELEQRHTGSLAAGQLGELGRHLFA